MMIADLPLRKLEILRGKRTASTHAIPYGMAWDTCLCFLFGIPVPRGGTVVSPTLLFLRVARQRTGTEVANTQK